MSYPWQSNYLPAATDPLFHHVYFNSTPQIAPANRFVYVKKNFTPTNALHNLAMPTQINMFASNGNWGQHQEQPQEHEIKSPATVLVNPHFKNTVYVNPNFKQAPPSVSKSNIHINPNVLKQSDATIMKNIMIDKKILEAQNTIPTTAVQKAIVSSQTVAPKKPPVISTKTKLVRVPTATIPQNIKTRRSLCSKYKIVKSTTSPKTKISPVKSPLLFASRYKISRVLSTKVGKGVQCKFKIDNRVKRSSLSEAKTGKVGKTKYVYVDRFLSMSRIAKNMLLKHKLNVRKSRFVNINGIMFRMSHNSLKKADLGKTTQSICKSKYKIVKTKTSDLCIRSEKSTKLKVFRLPNTKKVLPSKLKKNNIPCPMYRKYGKCSGKDNGKCIRIHNPNQIILCTKFLQGACINKNCLLSHKISPEKMPTCKYYLEGKCSREDCQYLHVKISPKADICRNFLEGFCEKATECDKRHQFLCPLYEKEGACPKRHCPYPHGSGVRKYSNLVHSTVAKKFSQTSKNAHKLLSTKTKDSLIVEHLPEKVVKVRYYAENQEEKLEQGAELAELLSSVETDCEPYLKNRPKLGQLPAFIPLFQDES